jgi:hypothetical protein
MSLKRGCTVTKIVYGVIQTNGSRDQTHLLFHGMPIIEIEFTSESFEEALEKALIVLPKKT